MAQWTDILDGLCDHLTLLQELGQRQVVIDPETMRALVQPKNRTQPPSARQPMQQPAPATPVPPSIAPQPAVPRLVETPGIFATKKPPLAPEERRIAMDKVAQQMAVCDACPLHKSRTCCVPGQGNFNTPDVMFIGEAPGAQEDHQGVAFIGPAGQLLTRMTAAMGYTREQVFISNICKCRPPGNRQPTPAECATCLPFLREQITIIRPKTIVLLGGTAIKALLKTQSYVSRIQGQWTQYEGIPVMPTYHPAYLLRFEPAKRDAWQALKRVLTFLGKPIPGQQQNT